MSAPSEGCGRRLGMPTSSAAALLKTMAQMNYLSFESTSRAYLPTPKLSQLGGWVTSASYEGGPIQEAVRRIGRKLGETVLLGTITDIYVEIVDILRARSRCNISPMSARGCCWCIPASAGHCSATWGTRRSLGSTAGRCGRRRSSAAFLAQSAERVSSRCAATAIAYRAVW